MGTAGESVVDLDKGEFEGETQQLEVEGSSGHGDGGGPAYPSRQREADEAEAPGGSVRGGGSEGWAHDAEAGPG